MIKRAQKLLIALMLCTSIGAWLAGVGSAQTVDVVFVHHSTGEYLFEQGGVAAWFTSYNTTHGTDYQVDAPWYPSTDGNYPYDYWHLWVNGGCDNSNVGIACMDLITTNYDAVIFKHCYPGADIEENSGAADVTSSDKELQNYILQYRALRAMMDSYPSTKFIVWTLVPLNPNATTVEKAARAKQFVDWVKGTWLTEGGQSHPNIFIFDFWGYVASQDASQGQINTLRTIYQRDSSDSHPNELANQVVGPIFSQFIVDVIENNASQTSAYLLWTK